MLILREKEIRIHNQAMKLYSLDAGRTWFSKAADLRRFKQRFALMKVSAQKRFITISEKKLPIANYDADFWR